MPRPGIDASLVGAQNEAAYGLLQSQYEALRETLGRRGIDIDKLKEKAAGFAAAIPSWAVGVGGGRFNRFPMAGEPRNILDKLDDFTVVHQLTGAAPLVSLHMPWDKHDDAKELTVYATARGLRFNAVNANTMSDAPGQENSYKFGSLSHVDRAVRRQAIEHNRECIALGKQIGAKALTVWAGEGSHLPGEVRLRGAFERYLASATEIYAAMPNDWRLYVEHKPDDPAFYSSVIEDWGTSFVVASALGKSASCLVGIGQAASGANMATVVARLVQRGKLGGFHINNVGQGGGHFGTGASDPYRLFLIFNEVADAEATGTLESNPVYLVDRSRNGFDPLESLMLSAMEIERAHVQAHLVDREALAAHQEANDALMASEALKQAFRTDVEPILAMARHEKGAAIEPIAAYRAAGYRQKIADARPRLAALGGGIV